MTLIYIRLRSELRNTREAYRQQQTTRLRQSLPAGIKFPDVRYQYHTSIRSPCTMMDRDMNGVHGGGIGCIL